MGLTNFPNGVTSFGAPVLSSGPDIPPVYGSVFWVDSNATNASDGNTGTKEKPLATLDAAVGKCTANKGDVILLAPGHTETLSAADDVDLDVAGVTVVGVGTGGLIPKFTITATVAFVVGADDVTVRNIWVEAGAADVAIGIDVNADDFWMDRWLITNDGTSNFVDTIHVGADNVADGLKITNCQCISEDTGNDGFVNFAGDCDRFVMIGNYVSQGVAADEPVLEVAGKSLTSCRILHNQILREQTAGDVFAASDQTDNSGVVAYNCIFSLDLNGAASAAIDLTGVGLFENYVLGVVDQQGYIDDISTGA